MASENGGKMQKPRRRNRRTGSDCQACDGNRSIARAVARSWVLATSSESCDSEGSKVARMIQEFKTTPCNLETSAPTHDHRCCPFFHSERDRRRLVIMENSSQPRYKAEPCMEQFDDTRTCPKGDDCDHCHSTAELLYHPEFFRKRLCHQAKRCPRGRFCAFAHTRQELLVPHFSEQEETVPTEEFIAHEFKTQWCPIGGPHDWENCVYAHTYRDWRRVPAVGYSSRPCMQWTQSVTGGPPELTYTQRCPRGFACPLAHGAKEQLYHPQFYKTSPCSEANCKRMALCAFTHQGRDVRKPCPGGPTSKEMREPLKNALAILETYQPTFWNPPRYHALEVEDTIKASTLHRSMGFGSGHNGQIPVQLTTKWSKPALAYQTSSDNQDWDLDFKPPRSNHWRMESESSSTDSQAERTETGGYASSVKGDSNAEAALSAVVNQASQMTAAMTPPFQYSGPQYQYQFVQYLPEGPYLPQVMPSPEDQWTMQCQMQQYWGGQWGGGTVPAAAIITQQPLWGPEGAQVMHMPAQHVENGMRNGNNMNACNAMNSPMNGCNGSVEMQMEMSDCGSPLCHGPMTGSPMHNGPMLDGSPVLQRPMLDGSPVFHSPIEAGGSPLRNAFQQPIPHAEQGSPHLRRPKKDSAEKCSSSNNSPSRRGYGYAGGWRTPSSGGSPALSGCNTDAPPSPRQGDESVPTEPSSSQADDEGCWLGNDPARDMGIGLHPLDVKGQWAQSSLPDISLLGKGKGKLKNGPGLNGKTSDPPMIMQTEERLISLPWV